jgi:hypothetical protein
MKPFFALAALVMAVPSFAATEGHPRIQFPDNFCRPGEEILNATKTCMDNRVFVDQADECLDKLQAAADRMGKAMPKGFSADDIAKQTGKFTASSDDYAYASQTFGDLSKLTDQVMDEVDGYQDYVNLPEDTMNAELNQGDPDAYAEMHPCYSETRDSIEDILADLQDMKNDFDGAKKVADAALATSTGRGNNLNQNSSLAGPGAASGAKGKGSGSVKGNAGTNQNGASDITGIKQDQDKANQK